MAEPNPSARYVVVTNMYHGTEDEPVAVADNEADALEVLKREGTKLGLEPVPGYSWGWIADKGAKRASIWCIPSAEAYLEK